MIIWLASYPRSGNTLLRSILFKSFGLGSYSVYSMGDVVEVNATPDYLEGVLLHYPQGWERFMVEATGSSQPFPIKTHGVPMEGGKVIYVVRDGRYALLSYWRFHTRHHPDLGVTLEDLIGGLDHFGDWSEHYHAWVGGNRDLLILKYEDLVEADMATLCMIGTFIGHSGEIKPWVNTYRGVGANQRGSHINYRTRWSGDEVWTPAIDAIFWRLHGGLMHELGYGSGPEISAQGNDQLSIEQLASAFVKVACEAKLLRRRVLEKQKQIELLSAICEERDNLILQLDRQLKQ
jgi:hypothetical protein